MAKKATRKAAAPRKEQADTAADLVKQNEEAAAGQTESQQEMLEYHKGEFQTHDPITGEERDLDEPFHVARVDRGETVEDAVNKGKK